MNSFQAMVSRVARAAVAGLSPADRKKMVMETFKRFKGMGDGAVKGGKHQIFLAAEGYETVTLEDASDEELSRIHSKYILGKKATEFATPEALEKYLKSHPNADRSKHTVKKDVSYVPKRHPNEVHKEVMGLSPSQVKSEVGKLSPEAKAKFEKVHGQLGHIKDEEKRNQYALLEVKSGENYERVETERKPKKKATSAQRVAEDSSVTHMRRSLANLTQAGARLRDAEGYVGGSLDLLIEALGFVKSANSDISDEDTEALEKELTNLIRRVGQESKAITSWIRELRVKASEAREQYESEIDYELQHPGE